MGRRSAPVSSPGPSRGRARSLQKSPRTSCPPIWLGRTTWTRRRPDRELRGRAEDGARVLHVGEVNEPRSGDELTDLMLVEEPALVVEDRANGDHAVGI